MWEEIVVKDGNFKAVLCAALGNIFWGFSFLFINVALTVASDPYIMLGHRFSISALVMAGMLLVGKKKISFKGKNWKPVALLLITQLCYYLFESYGILYTNSCSNVCNSAWVITRNNFDCNAVFFKPIDGLFSIRADVVFDCNKSNRSANLW